MPTPFASKIYQNSAKCSTRFYTGRTKQKGGKRPNLLITHKIAYIYIICAEFDILNHETNVFMGITRNL